MNSHNLSLEGIFEGNLFKIDLENPLKDVKLIQRSQFEQIYILQSPGSQMTDVVFSDGYFVSMQYDGGYTYFLVYSIDGYKMSEHKIHANCNGLSTTHKGTFVTIGTICNLSDKV